MSTLITLLTGGGLLAAGGLLNGWQNSRNASKRDQATHTHEMAMAAETRRQDRLERAYTELGMFLAHWGDWASSVYPFIGPVPRPDPMLPQERHRIGTLVANHGSPEVRALLTQWAEIAAKIENAGHVITMAEQSQNPGALDEQAQRERLALEDYRKALYEAASRVFDRMSYELNGQAAQGAS
jgi:hypothetical protein